MKNDISKNRGDIKCVWMHAGVVSYKLCNLNFQCESCEFDRVMRGWVAEQHQGPAISQTSPQPAPVPPAPISEPGQQMAQDYLFYVLSGCQIHLDRCYHPSNLWLLPEDENTLIVGIDKLVMKILNPVQGIILPEPGQYYSEGQLIAWIIRNGQTIPLHAPVSGTVIDVNTNLARQQDQPLPANDFWLFKLNGKNIVRQIKQSCDTVPGLQEYHRKVEILKSHLLAAFEHQSNELSGTTLADGGKIESCLEKVLGVQPFKKLIAALFPPRP